MFQDGEVSKTIPVLIMEDELFEDDESFTLVLTNVKGRRRSLALWAARGLQQLGGWMSALPCCLLQAQHGATVGPTPKCTVTILNDDEATSIKEKVRGNQEKKRVAAAEAQPLRLSS